MAFSTTINFTLNANTGERGFTNNKILLSHFEPLSFVGRSNFMGFGISTGF